MSLPKIPAIFSRGQNQRWPPTPFWKIYVLNQGTNNFVQIHFFDKFDNEDSKSDNNLALGFHFHTKFQDGRHPIVKKVKIITI